VWSLLPETPFIEVYGLISVGASMIRTVFVHQGLLLYTLVYPGRQDDVLSLWSEDDQQEGTD
jgi:hypothetical protein